MVVEELDATKDIQETFDQVALGVIASWAFKHHEEWEVLDGGGTEDDEQTDSDYYGGPPR